MEQGLVPPVAVARSTSVSATPVRSSAATAILTC